MLAPCSIFEPEPLGLCQQCSHNLIHDSCIARTYAATVSLLGALWNLSVGKKKNTSWVSEWKVRYKRETIGRQRNVTFWWVFSLTLQLSLPLFSVFSPLFFVLHSLLYCRSLQPSLMLIYAAWLAQHQRGGVLSLDYQQWKREGGEGWGMGGWGEGDLDRHLI